MCGRKLFRTPIVLDFIPEAGSQTLWRGCGSSLLVSCGNWRSDKGLGQKATPTVPSAAHTTLCKHYSQRARSGIKRSGCAPLCLEPYWGLLLLRFPQEAVIGSVSPIPKVCLDQVTSPPRGSWCFPLSPVGSSWSGRCVQRLSVSSDTERLVVNPSHPWLTEAVLTGRGGSFSGQQWQLMPRSWPLYPDVEECSRVGAMLAVQWVG